MGSEIPLLAFTTFSHLTSFSVQHLRVTKHWGWRHAGGSQGSYSYAIRPLSSIGVGERQERLPERDADRHL